MAAMENGIAEYRLTGKGTPYENLSVFDQKDRDSIINLWKDSLGTFGECVEKCVSNQSGDMGGEEDIYRTATLLMATVFEEHKGSYEFVYGHGEDTEKTREDFRAVIEGENPVDESKKSFYEEFGIYYYAEALVSEMMAEAWQEEFHHCLGLVRDRVRQSGDGEKEQRLEILEAVEDFFETWAGNEKAYEWHEFYYELENDNEELYEWLRSGGGLRTWQAESEAGIFRTGTLLLVDGLEQSGGSYEFIYEEEPDRQELTKLLGIHPDTEEGTWKQEYEICLAAMELGISRYDVTGANIAYENLPDYDKWASDRSMELWQDSLSAFNECMEVCTRNQTGGMEGEEETYRMAVLLMKTMCESRNGHYTLAHTHGEDLEKAQEDFRAVLERGNPIDESNQIFYEEFGCFYDAEFEIPEMTAEAWQEEFRHCLDTVKDRVRQSGNADQEQTLEALEAWEDFFEVWADNEEAYEHIEGGTGMDISIAESRAEVFRTGTMLLIDGLEKSGVSYEFIYDSEPDRQYLKERYSG